MQSNSLKPLGYYQSDRRDTDIMTEIALEFGDYFERLSRIQRQEALAVLAIANLTNSIQTALEHIHLSIGFVMLPRLFCLRASELTHDGRFALSIALAQSLRNHP